LRQYLGATLKDLALQKECKIEEGHLMPDHMYILTQEAIAGMEFALALYRRGEVSDAIIAHMTTNTSLAFYIMFTGNWS